MELHSGGGSGVGATPRALAPRKHLRPMIRSRSVLIGVLALALVMEGAITAVSVTGIRNRWTASMPVFSPGGSGVPGGNSSTVAPPPAGADICLPVCSDGYVFGSEKCDDGNTVNGDGCSATCQPEAGWECLPVSSPPAMSFPCVDGACT